MFVLNVVDGCIPSDLGTGSSEDIEEERRLLYVAMTRAKDHLSLVVPHRFYVTQQARTGDKHLYAMRSRFIPSSITEHFEQETWPRTARSPHPAAISGGITVDLSARMRGRWRKTGS